MPSRCDVSRQRYDWLHFVKTSERRMVALKAWMTYLGTSGPELPQSVVACHYVAKSLLVFAKALHSRPLNLVSVANSRIQSKPSTAPLMQTACWTFSLPCFSFMVEIQSVAKSWIFKPHLKLKVVSIWRKMEIYTCGVIPLALLADAAQQRHGTTQKGMKLLRSSIYWIY